MTEGPPVPDYPRLRAEIDAGGYPFDAGDEGELFARCEWLEAQNVNLVALTYPMTPVDALLSDLYAMFVCGGLSDDYWRGRLAEFTREVSPSG